MALDGAEDLTATREAELAVELAGEVEGEDLVGLFEEEGFGLGEEMEMGVAFEDLLKMGVKLGLVLDQFGSRAVLFDPAGFLLFGGFGN